MLVLLLALACEPWTPPVAPPATEPAAPELDDAPDSPLYEQLYAGEPGPVSRILGDRVRILAWLHALAPSPAQLAALRAASRDVRARLATAEDGAAKADLAAAEALGPGYRALATALARETGPADADLATAAAQITTARAGLTDARSLRTEAVRAAMDRAGGVVDAFSTDQRAAMRHALFFLRRPLGSDFSPDAWSSVLGQTWEGGDFGTLARTSPGPEAPGSLDIGGIWRIDGDDATKGISRLRLQVLVGLALAHPGLCGALDARAGLLPADDTRDTCAPAGTAPPSMEDTPAAPTPARTPRRRRDPR